MLFKRFEDMKVWQDSRVLAYEVYAFTNLQHFKRDFALRDQIRRSAISIMANIAEGFERKSNNEFVQFLRYSVSSAAETKSHLYLAFDLGYISNEQLNSCSFKLEVISKQIKGLIRYLSKYN